MSDPIDPALNKTKISAVLRWVEEGTGKRQSLFLHEGNIAQLGRSNDNAVCIKGEKVSRHHATVAWRDGSFFVTDLKSTNGTFVNDERVTQARKLDDNDIIRLDKQSLVFCIIHQATIEISKIQKSDETFIVRQDAAQPRLIITTGIHEGDEHLLFPGKILIGRATSKISFDISLQDEAISRPQVEIENKDDTFFVTDMESANGTLVNGNIINETTELHDGDLIEIGETTMLFRAR